MAVTAVGGLLPPLGPHGYQPGGPAYHFVGFSVLTVLLSATRPPVQAAALAWAYGLLLEGVQYFVPYRGAELGDVVMNLVAVVLGALAARGVRG